MQKNNQKKKITKQNITSFKGRPVSYRGNHLTPKGHNWMAQALDPFPDMDRPVVGWPDGNASNSVLRKVTKSISISKPAGITSGTWDAHVTMTPVISRRKNGGDPVAQAVDVDNDFSHIGFMQTDYVPTKTIPTWGVVLVNTVGNLSNTFTPGNADPNSEYVAIDIGELAGGLADQGTGSGSLWRMVSGGFEVVNTTAQLSKQGSCIVYSQPNEPFDADYRVVSTVDEPAILMCGPMRFTVLSAPPATPAAALQLRGSVQWEAAEGAYVQARFNNTHNELAQPRNLNVLFEHSTQVAGSMPDFALNLPNEIQVPGAAVVGDSYAQPTLLAPIDGSGAYFTGLSLETTLTVTVHCYLEQVPTAGSSDASIVSGGHSTSDPAALAAYMNIIRKLPPGAKVGDNYSGEWWHKVKQMLRPLVEVVPEAGMVLGSIDAAANGIRDTVRAVKKAAKTKPPKKT